MGLVPAFVRRGVYSAVTRSGVILLLIPVLKPFKNFLSKFFGGGSKHNHLVVDASGEKIRVCRVDERNYPPFGVERIKRVKDFEMRPEDILLCGYPKTGCHWMYEILFMLRTGKTQISKHGKEIGGMIDGIPEILIDSCPSPRVLNSHMLYGNLPTDIHKHKTKIVYTVRNPKDTAVSFYNHIVNLSEFYNYKGTFNDNFQLFMDGKLEYGDFFEAHLDWEHVMKSEPDTPILMVTFEDMKSEPVKCVLRVAKFLEIPIDHQRAQEVVEACDFKKMKKKRENDMSGKLIRKGQVGDWRNWLSESQSQAIDQRWAEKMQECTYQPQM